MDLLNFLRVQWDRTGAVAATVLGLLVLLLGYLGTADTEFIAEQIPYLVSGGLFGIALLTIGAVLWLSADLRDEWRLLRDRGEAIRLEQLERRGSLEQRVAELVALELGAREVDVLGQQPVPAGARRRAARRVSGRDETA